MKTNTASSPAPQAFRCPPIRIFEDVGGYFYNSVKEIKKLGCLDTRGAAYRSRAAARRAARENYRMQFELGGAL